MYVNANSFYLFLSSLSIENIFVVDTWLAGVSLLLLLVQIVRNHCPKTLHNLFLICLNGKSNSEKSQISTKNSLIDNVALF